MPTGWKVQCTYHIRSTVKSEGQVLQFQLYSSSLVKVSSFWTPAVCTASGQKVDGGIVGRPGNDATVVKLWCYNYVASDHAMSIISKNHIYVITHCAGRVCTCKSHHKYTLQWSQIANSNVIKVKCHMGLSFTIPHWQWPTKHFQCGWPLECESVWGLTYKRHNKSRRSSTAGYFWVCICITTYNGFL